VEKTFETPSPLRLDLQVPSGRIEVEAAETGSTQVWLTGSEELVERATIELHGDELRVHAHERKGLFLQFDKHDFFLRVRCPEGSSLHARSKSADVETNGRLAQARVETASGDVSIDRCEGASVKSASGGVTVREAAGDLTVGTASGDVEVGRAGRLVANLVSGDVHVREVAGPVTANSVSGDVRVDAVTAGDVSVQAVSGDVQIGVRRGSLVYVDASSLSGDTRSELELGDLPSAEDGPRIDLRLKTVSGDISVVRAAVPAPTPL
jgi:hypothetical protein